jgi:hypothetical protein
MAYDPGFTGGVYVAAGDVNGDHHADIITGEGAGGLPEVEAFSGVDGSLLYSFLANDPTFSGGVRVATWSGGPGGIADIVTSLGLFGQPAIHTYDGQSLLMLDAYYAFDAHFLGGVFVGGC